VDKAVSHANYLWTSIGITVCFSPQVTNFTTRYSFVSINYQQHPESIHPSYPHVFQNKKVLNKTKNRTFPRNPHYYYYYY